VTVNALPKFRERGLPFLILLRRVADDGLQLLRRGTPRIAALLGDKEGAVSLLRQAIKQGYAYSGIHPTEDFESLADFPPYVQLMKPKG